MPAAKKPATPPKRIHLRCKIDGCDFYADADDDNLQQYADLVLHFQSHQPERSPVDKKNLGTGSDGLPGHPTPSSPSVVNALWDELVELTGKALTWPKVPESDDPWQDETQRKIAVLQNDLRKAQATSIGRGIAIALSKFQYKAYPTADDIIQEAVRRWKEQQS